MTKEGERDLAGEIADADAETATPEGDASGEPRRRRKMGMRVPSDRVPRPDRSQPDIPLEPQPGAAVAPSAVASAFGKSGPIPVSGASSMITTQKPNPNGERGERPNGERPAPPQPTGHALDAWAKDGWTPPPSAYPARAAAPMAIDPADLIPRIESTRVPLPPPPPPVTLKPSPRIDTLPPPPTRVDPPTRVEPPARIDTLPPPPTRVEPPAHLEVPPPPPPLTMSPGDADAIPQPMPVPGEVHGATPPTGVPALAAAALAAAEAEVEPTLPPPPALPPPRDASGPVLVKPAAPAVVAPREEDAPRTIEMVAVQPPPDVEVDVDVDVSTGGTSEELSDADLVTDEPTAVAAPPVEALGTAASSAAASTDIDKTPPPLPELPPVGVAAAPAAEARALVTPTAEEAAEDGVELSGDEIEEVGSGPTTVAPAQAKAAAGDDTAAHASPPRPPEAAIHAPAPAPAQAASPPPAPAVHGTPPPAPPVAAHATPPPAPAAAAATPPDLGKRKRRGTAWFEEVFDEDYLRTLPYLTPATTQREAGFIAESLNAPAGAQLLDLGCGYGRHAMELASRGFQMVGVDLSLPLLIRGADEAQRRGLTINFVHGDMRELSFDETFDGAFSWFTSFGYFDDEANRKVVQGVARALKVGGRFLIEVVNRDYIVSEMPMRVWWEGDGCVVLEEVDFNYYTSRLVSQRSVVFEDARQVEQEISIRAYGLHELGKLLHQCGFRVVEVSGSIAIRGRFFGAHSRNLIILAEKRAPKDQ
ncbi:MAG: methyltransferase domain-containing protein [Deltaproteobacteria bacterium]|nr:methyltransferase domain-containing protein [Deltaproteobacteria bacterium]